MGVLQGLGYNTWMRVSIVDADNEKVCAKGKGWEGEWVGIPLSGMVVMFGNLCCADKEDINFVAFADFLPRSSLLSRSASLLPQDQLTLCIEV